VLGLDDNTAFFGVYDGHGGKEVRSARAPSPESASRSGDPPRLFLSFDARTRFSPLPRVRRRRKTRPAPPPASARAP
jgi:hypothetical protein